MPDYDKILGMLIGHHLGDALGMPHERLNCVEHTGPYTGILQYEPNIRRRCDKVRKWYPVGYVSDDSEKTINIAKSIAKYASCH